MSNNKHYTGTFLVCLFESWEWETGLIPLLPVTQVVGEKYLCKSCVWFYVISGKAFFFKVLDMELTASYAY